jgi:hypothetical protein
LESPFLEIQVAFTAQLSCCFVWLGPSRKTMLCFRFAIHCAVVVDWIGDR